MKKITEIRALFIILFFGGVISILGCFNLFPKEEESLCVISPLGENFKLEIVSVATGATTDATLQIKKIENGKTQILKTISKYDAISGYSINGTYMEIFIYDSLSSDNKVDTTNVNFK